MHAEGRSERQGVEQRVAPVEAAAVGPHRIRGQEPAAQRQGDQPDRDVDGEEPGPRGRRKDGCGQRGARHRGDGDHRGVDPHAAAQLRTGIDDADERGVDRRHGCGAEPLGDARREECGQRAGQGAGRRGRREERQSGDVDLPVSDHLAQRRQRKQRDDDGRLVSVDDPHGVGGADSQFGRERGQRDVGDGAVDDGQPHAECDGEDGPQTPGHGQPVAKGGGIGLRRGGKHAAKVTKKRRPGNLRVPVGRDFSVRVSLRRRRMSRASAYPVRAARGYTGRVMTPDRMKQNYDIFSKNND